MVLDPSQIDWIIAEAQRSLVEGVLYEPRCYYDVIQLSGTPTPITDPVNEVSDIDITPGTTGAFYNNEQFPVRITRMTISLLYLTETGETPPPTFVAADERLMSQLALRLRVYDSYYQSRIPARLPLWQNEIPSIPDVIAPGVVVWHFDRPLILSSRDALQPIAQITSQAITSSRDVSVAFQGAGYITRRPYYIEGTETFLKPTQRQDFDNAPYRNDGSEPIVIHTMTVRVGAEATALDPTGDSRTAGLFCSQIGNGTNAPWIHTPPTALAAPFNNITACPIALLGGDGGRAIIHRFVGTGLVWEPGEGVDIDATNLGVTQLGQIALGVGMLGYIAVR